MHKRPSFDEYYINIAKVISERSTCLRRRYGSVLVKDNKIVATGYNGAPIGDENCCDTGKCIRKEMNIAPGTQYEKCCSVHSEQNTLLSASSEEAKDATLYIAGFNVDDESIASGNPCMMCRRVIKNAKVEKVVMTIQDSDELKTVYVTDL